MIAMKRDYQANNYQFKVDYWKHQGKSISIMTYSEAFGDDFHAMKEYVNWGIYGANSYTK